MKPLRLLYLDTEASWRGGQEQLLSLMQGLKKKGHDVHLAAPPEAPLAERCRNLEIPLHPFRQRAELSLRGFGRLMQILGAHRFDVVHSNTPRTLITAGAAARLRHRPLCVTSRRVVFPLRSPLSRLKYNWTQQGVIAICRSIQSVLAQGGVNPDRIRVVYEGVDLCWFDQLEKPSFERGLEEVLIGMVAHMSQEKGHADLLKAASLLVSRFPEARYVLIGDGALREDLEQQCRQMRLQEFVRFTGFRNDSEALMKHLDIFCLPSHSEGFSSALLAAMANRLPSVVTQVGGNRELVMEGETGFLVPPADPAELAEALWRLLQSRQLRHRLGQAARVRVEENFTLDKQIEQTEAAYRSWLGSLQEDP